MMKMLIVRILMFGCWFLAAESCVSQTIEDKIILVNIGKANREEIASLLNLISKCRPRVVAIDAFFSNSTISTHNQNQKLFSALLKFENLVMANVISNYAPESNINYNRFSKGSSPEFLISAHTGFVNTILDDENGVKKLKRFATNEKFLNQIEYHFSVVTAMRFDSLKTVTFLENKPKIVEVDYKDGKRNFTKYSIEDFQKGKVSQGELEGKIIMLGYLGPSSEDKFHTPLNKEEDRFGPDMYGLEYLAHIVAQVLEN